MTDTTPEAVERLIDRIHESKAGRDVRTDAIATLRAQQAEIARLTAQGEDMAALIDAAHGLSFGDDWNGGTAAKALGYREKLLVAIARIKGGGASPQAIAALAKQGGAE